MTEPACCNWISCCYLLSHKKMSTSRMLAVEKVLIHYDFECGDDNIAKFNPRLWIEYTKLIFFFHIIRIFLTPAIGLASGKMCQGSLTLSSLSSIVKKINSTLMYQKIGLYITTDILKLKKSTCWRNEHFLMGN